jgi:CDP-glycerol glycerophosphotransferase (TagB/SpsB family)
MFLKVVARSVYALLKILPVQRKLVLISRLSTTPSIDFTRIAQHARDNYPDLTVVTLNHKMDNRFLHVFAILQEMYHLATAQACVVESYVISVSILRHRKSLVIVQIWHSLGAIKAFGHATIGRAEGNSADLAAAMHMHENYTYVVSGAAATVPIFAKCFNVDESIVKPIGMPRVDYLLDASIQAQNRQRVTQHYKLPAGKKVILYAPTFRKGTKIPYSQLIDAVDFSRYTLIIKPHPHDKTRIDASNAGQAIVDRTFQAMELLPAVDYVITDYSGISFEAALLRKPLFFWLCDLERYGKRRSFALDVQAELPGFQSTSAVDVLQAIDHNNYDAAAIAAYGKRFVAVQDGTCTARLFDLLGVAS